MSSTLLSGTEMTQSVLLYMHFLPPHSPKLSYHRFPRTTRFEPVRVCASSFLAETTSQKQQQRAKMSHAQILDNKANTSSLSDVRPKLSANSVRSKIERVDCLWRTRKVMRLSC